MPDGARGPLFVGKLLVPKAGEPNAARITAANGTCVWAADSFGALRLIARTGDRFDAQRKVTALTLLNNMLGSPSQRRSFSDDAIIYRATLSDGSQHIAVVETP